MEKTALIVFMELLSKKHEILRMEGDLAKIMAEKNTAIASQLQIDLQEKICIALVLIGFPEAIQDLSEIAESKSFLATAFIRKK